MDNFGTVLDLLNQATDFFSSLIDQEVSIVASSLTILLFVLGSITGTFKVLKFFVRLLRRFIQKFNPSKIEGLYRADIFDLNENIIQV